MTTGLLMKATTSTARVPCTHGSIVYLVIKIIHHHTLGQTSWLLLILFSVMLPNQQSESGFGCWYLVSHLTDLFFVCYFILFFFAAIFPHILTPGVKNKEKESLGEAGRLRNKWWCGTWREFLMRGRPRWVSVFGWWWWWWGISVEFSGR